MSSPATAQHEEFTTYEGYKTCRECHSSELDGHAADIMESLHWTWEKNDSHTGQAVGKINIINNYCVAVPSNEPRCTSCHIGIGWTDKTFNKANRDNIDCLVCHDQTGTYKKTPTGAGAPQAGLNYAAISRSITPVNVKRENCGACHFYGGGGDAVKHGSLDSTMANPSRDLDIHMGGAQNMSCTACHVPDNNKPHEIVGSRYSKATPDSHLCESCHTPAPHSSGLINTHAQRVSCQACHIPAYARGGKATKLWWDWSTAGQKDNGNLIKLLDENGDIIYDTMKGDFEWEKDVVPEYVWANGNVRHVTLNDPVIVGEVLKINEFMGDHNDPNARIVPVKRFRGRQPYDAGMGTLAIPKLFPPTNPDAYWNNYDWPTALAAGMNYVGKSFTGPVGYVETEMLWVQNHMVAPKEQALSCRDCHQFGSRLNFLKLGYPVAEASALQLRFGGDWMGYPVNEGFVTDTGSWLGWVYVANAPYIYVYNLASYIYVPGQTVSESSGWAYLMK